MLHQVCVLFASTSNPINFLCSCPVSFSSSTVLSSWTHRCAQTSYTTHTDTHACTNIAQSQHHTKHIREECNKYLVLKTSPITHPNVFSIDEHLQQVQSVSVSERVRGRERLKKQEGGRGRICSHAVGCVALVQRNKSNCISKLFMLCSLLNCCNVSLCVQVVLGLVAHPAATQQPGGGGGEGCAYHFLIGQGRTAGT